VKFANLVQSMVLSKDTDDFTLPGQQQREAARRFEHMFRGQGLYLWGSKPKDPHRKLIVIGVSTASLLDMELMDELAASSRLWILNGVRVEAFNVYYFQTLREFEQRIPGLGKVYQTPVVGVCEKGEWTTRATGHSARKFIEDFIRDLPAEMPRRGANPPLGEPKVRA